MQYLGNEQKKKKEKKKMKPYITDKSTQFQDHNPQIKGLLNLSFNLMNKFIKRLCQTLREQEC